MKNKIFFAGHLDHLKTHVVSAIFNIQQNVDEDWPLQIFDHDDNLHHILLKPGEMVWYESARLFHGRSIPLNGTSFENLFIHYMPTAATTGNWYNSDYLVSFGEPLVKYTLEDLMKHDVDLSDVPQNMRAIHKDTVGDNNQFKSLPNVL